MQRKVHGSTFQKMDRRIIVLVFNHMNSWGLKDTDPDDQTERTEMEVMWWMLSLDLIFNRINLFVFHQMYVGGITFRIRVPHWPASSMIHMEGCRSWRGWITFWIKFSKLEFSLKDPVEKHRWVIDMKQKFNHLQWERSFAARLTDDYRHIRARKRYILLQLYWTVLIVRIS